MFWCSSCNFTDGDISVQLVVSVCRSKKDAISGCSRFYGLRWGTYGRLIVTSDVGQLAADPNEVTVTISSSGAVFSGQEAISFLSTREGFPQSFEQSNCLPSPYIGNKYALE